MQEDKIATQEDTFITNGHISDTSSQLGTWIAFLWLLTQCQIIAVALKLDGVIAFDWWIIAIPTWVPTILAIAMVALARVLLVFSRMP